MYCIIYSFSYIHITIFTGLFLFLTMIVRPNLISRIRYRAFEPDISTLSLLLITYQYLCTFTYMTACTIVCAFLCLSSVYFLSCNGLMFYRDIYVLTHYLLYGLLHMSSTMYIFTASSSVYSATVCPFVCIRSSHSELISRCLSVLLRIVPS